jgi:hypothetical protein
MHRRGNSQAIEKGQKWPFFHGNLPGNNHLKCFLLFKLLCNSQDYFANAAQTPQSKSE